MQQNQQLSQKLAEKSQPVVVKSGKQGLKKDQVQQIADKMVSKKMKSME